MIIIKNIHFSYTKLFLSFNIIQFNKPEEYIIRTLIEHKPTVILKNPKTIVIILNMVIINIAISYLKICIICSLKIAYYIPGSCSGII